MPPLKSPSCRTLWRGPTPQDAAPRLAAGVDAPTIRVKTVPPKPASSQSSPCPANVFPLESVFSLNHCPWQLFSADPIRPLVFPSSIAQSDSDHESRVSVAQAGFWSNATVSNGRRDYAGQLRSPLIPLNQSGIFPSDRSICRISPFQNEAPEPFSCTKHLANRLFEGTHRPDRGSATKFCCFFNRRVLPLQNEVATRQNAQFCACPRYPSNRYERFV